MTINTFKKSPFLLVVDADTSDHVALKQAQLYKDLQAYKRGSMYKNIGPI